MENKSTNKIKCIFVIVILWMVLIFFIFTMTGEKNDKKFSQNSDSRQHLSSSNSENRTNDTKRLNRVELSRDHFDHFMYKGQINEDDVFFIEAGMSGILNPGHISDRL